MNGERIFNAGRAGTGRCSRGQPRPTSSWRRRGEGRRGGAVLRTPIGRSLSAPPVFVQTTDAEPRESRRNDGSGEAHVLAYVVLNNCMNQKPQSSSAQTAKPQSGPPPSTPPSGPPSEKRDEAARIVQASATEDVRALGSQAKDVASDVAHQVAQSAERQFAGGKDRAAEAIHQIAGALRQTGDELLGKDMPVANDYLGKVAGQVESMSSYLRSKRLDDVGRDLEAYARREPVLFIGSAFLLGTGGWTISPQLAAGIGYPRHGGSSKRPMKEQKKRGDGRSAVRRARQRYRRAGAPRGAARRH